MPHIADVVHSPFANRYSSLAILSSRSLLETHMPIVECRRCGKVVQYREMKDLPFFPFCSKRCKMIDLGQWLDEEHRLHGEASAADEGGTSK